MTGLGTACLLVTAAWALADSGRSPRPPLFPPGEALEVAASRGVSQIGRTQDARGAVRGVADVFGNGPLDLIVAPDRLFPFREFDANGAPVYDAPRAIAAAGLGGIVASQGDEILGLRAADSRIELLVLDRATLKFERRAVSESLTLPGGMAGPMAGMTDAAGRLDVYFGVHDGQAYHPEGPHHHRFEYMPYDGAGFWRGGIPRCALHHVRFDASSMKVVQPARRAGTGPGEFLFDLRGMTIWPEGEKGRCSLVTSEKLGVLRRFPIESGTGAPVRPEFVNDEERVALRHDVINPSVAAFADPKTGRQGLVVNDTGRLWFYPVKSSEERMVCQPAVPLRAPVSAIALGALPVISPGDIDGDGRIDFVAGNDAGQLLFVRNIGTRERPEFDEPVPLDVGGRPLDIKAGYRGSIQGPGEAMWGYTAPTVVDWNGDGLPDVILNSILADYMVLLQVPNSSPPRFTEPRLMFCDGLQLHLAWRCQPVVGRWEEGGRLGLIALDEKNLLRQFWRIDNLNVERGDLLRFQDGSPINANYDEGAGQTGRTEMILTDWDSDGVLDIVTGTSRGLSIPASKTVFYPSSFGETRAASVLVLRNAGTNREPSFEYARLVEFNGERIQLGIHTCSPAFFDLGRGVRDLFVAEEMGGINYYPGESLTLSKPAP